MTSIKTAIVAFAFVASLGTSTAFAAISPDGYEAEDERECEFVAETGGYQCETEQLGYSLSDLQDQNGKKKKIIMIPPVLILP